MAHDTVTATLAILKPDDLYPSWCLIDMHEQRGWIGTDEAWLWKHGIYELMLRWGVGA